MTPRRSSNYLRIALAPPRMRGDSTFSSAFEDPRPYDTRPTRPRGEQRQSTRSPRRRRTRTRIGSTAPRRTAAERSRSSFGFAPPPPRVPVRGFLRTEASAAAAGSSQLPHPKRPGTFGAPLQANHARKDYFLYELLPFALGLVLVKL